MTDHLTREQLLDFMAKHNACSPATTWVKMTTGTPEQLYAKCKNPQWMLWLAGEAGLKFPLVLAAGDIARSVLKYVPKGEDRPRAAIEVAARIGRDELTGNAAQAAADAAWAAARAAADAAADAAGCAGAAARAAADAAWAAAWAAAGDAAVDAAVVAAGDAARAAGNAGGAAEAAARAAQNQTSAKLVHKNIPMVMLARAIMVTP